jgi:hypothetical protein
MNIKLIALRKSHSRHPRNNGRYARTALRPDCQCELDCRDWHRPARQCALGGDQGRSCDLDGAFRHGESVNLDVSPHEIAAAADAEQVANIAAHLAGGGNAGAR